MKRVTYNKFKHIQWKFDAKQNMTEHFKSKQQKSFISYNVVTRLLILQNFSNPFPLKFYSNHVTSSYYSNY